MLNYSATTFLEKKSLVTLQRQMKFGRWEQTQGVCFTPPTLLSRDRSFPNSLHVPKKRDLFGEHNPPRLRRLLVLQTKIKTRFFIHICSRLPLFYIVWELPLCGNYPFSAALCGNYPFSAALCGNYPFSAALCGNYPFSVALCGNYPFSVALCGNYPFSAALYGNYPFTAALCDNYPFSAALCGNYSFSAALCGNYPFSAPLCGNYPFFLRHCVVMG